MFTLCIVYFVCSVFVFFFFHYYFVQSAVVLFVKSGRQRFSHLSLEHDFFTLSFCFLYIRRILFIVVPLLFGLFIDLCTRKKILMALTTTTLINCINAITNTLYTYFLPARFDRETKGAKFQVCLRNIFILSSIFVRILFFFCVFHSLVFLGLWGRDESTFFFNLTQFFK